MIDVADDLSQCYFCYGADMGSAWIRDVCGNDPFVSIARIPDHRMVFVGHSRQWDGAEEALLRSVGDSVWGVVYRVSFSGGDSLDSAKDIRLNGTGIRFHFPTSALLPEGSEIPVLYYQKDALGENLYPSEEYLSLIVAAARERGLPDSYVDSLLREPSRPAGYPVPKKIASRWASLSGHSCDCGM